MGARQRGILGRAAVARAMLLLLAFVLCSAALASADDNLLLNGELTKGIRLILEEKNKETGEQILHSLKLDGVGEDRACRFLAQDVLIRDISMWPGCEGCLRVSIGTPEENDRFIAALAQVFSTAATHAD